MLIPSVAQPIPDGWVTVDGSVYRALIAEDEPEVDPRQTLVVSDRDVRLRWDGKALQIRSVWRLVPKERTWLITCADGEAMLVALNPEFRGAARGNPEPLPGDPLAPPTPTM